MIRIILFLQEVEDRLIELEALQKALQEATGTISWLFALLLEISRLFYMEKSMGIWADPEVGFVII